MIPLLKKMVFDIKTYVSIHYKNRKRFPSSRVESYIPQQLKLGKRVVVKESCFFSHKLKTIGNGTYIGNGTLIMNCSEIGNFCSISHSVKIGMDNHLLEGISTNPLVCAMPIGECTIIGHDVLISANVVIMSGLKIGNGAVIGANSFVNKEVPPYAIVAGSPAKIIRFRFDEEKIDKIEHSKWWEKDIEIILKNKDKSSDIDTFLKSMK
jgi:acetyltransferase-like isoleucine patch superfamily enzyme